MLRSASAITTGRPVEDDDELQRLRDENETLRFRIRDLERNAFGDVLLFPPEWKLTNVERRILSVLTKRRLVPHDALVEAVYRDSEIPMSNSLSCHLARLRQKLDPLGLYIETQIMVGYWVSQETQQRLKAESGSLAL